MNREIKAAVDYIMMQMTDKDLPSDALRQMIEQRVRMVCADALRWQARAMQTVAENL